VWIEEGREGGREEGSPHLRIFSHTIFISFFYNTEELRRGRLEGKE
jgi:hypothetical protein